MLHSPDKDSDIRMSANVLDLAGEGFGTGAVGVTYRRDLDAVAVRRNANSKRPVHPTQVQLPRSLPN